MKDGPNIVRIAALIGDHARTEVLTALMGGKALTATELAKVAGVTKQTISAHLAKLVDAQLIAVESQGRHRYFRLADDDVVHLLESLMGVAFRTGAVRLRSSPREPAMRKARVCYDHLAGELSVQIYESLLKREAFAASADGLSLTASGHGSSKKPASMRMMCDRSAAIFAALVSTGASAGTISPVRLARLCLNA